MSVMQALIAPNPQVLKESLRRLEQLPRCRHQELLVKLKTSNALPLNIYRSI